MCHVSFGRPCHHLEAVFLGNVFDRWSFLTLHSVRWSFVSKNQRAARFMSSAERLISIDDCLSSLPFHTMEMFDTHAGFDKHTLVGTEPIVPARKGL
jgi:hypothetical protein